MLRRKSKSCLVLLAASAAGEPPTDFRIWRHGWNPTRNGYDVLFDETAAKMVATAFAEHGVRCMIDLEHLSLEDPKKSVGYDPDARGYCSLEVRPDAQGHSELWAVDVKWTPDGKRRLTEGTQPYASPAFWLDDDFRPTRVINIAICAMPATDNIEALMAAKENTTMKVSLLLALSALMSAAKMSKSGVAPRAIIHTLAEGEGDTGGEVAGVDIKALADLLGIAIDPSNDPAGFIAALCAELDKVLSRIKPTATPAETPPAEEMAAAAEVCRITGAKSLVSSIVVLADWRKLAVDHKAVVDKQKAEEQAIEERKYVAMTTRLVVCGAELPGTAWTDGDGKTPSKAIRVQSLDDLEKRATAFEAKNGIAGSSTTHHTPIVTGDHGLSAVELAMCKRRKIDPAEYAARFKKSAQAQTGART